MATIYGSVTLDLSVDDLWAMIADVGGLSALLDVIQESSASGDQRSCTLADGASLRETIVGVDEENRRVAYTITESPFPLEHHAASMQALEARDGKSTFLWITDLKPDGLADSFRQLIDGELASLGKRFGEG